MLPAQMASEPSGFVLRHVVGQIAILDDHQAAVNVHDIADFLQWVAFGNHLAGHLRSGEDVIADIFGPGDIDQRVVDLEIEQLPDAATAGVGHRAALGKRGQHSAVAVGAQGQAIGGVQQDLAGGGIDRRHRALTENVKVFRAQAETVVRGQETERLLMRRRTGHQVQRYPHAVPPGHGLQLLDVDLKQCSAGNGANRKLTLGVVKSQAGSLPSRHQDHTYVTVRKPLLSPRTTFGRRETVLGNVQPEGRRFRCPQSQVAKIALVVPLGIQLLDQREIDTADLPSQQFLLPRLQLGPKTQ